MTFRSFQYGPDEHQSGDLHLPTASRPPVVCLLHGGFWKMPYGRDGTAALAQDLVQRGYAVCNLEYRRVGAPGGGWPGTFEDVAAGIDHLAMLLDEGIDIDLERVAVVGHSAGGQLALSSANRRQAPANDFAPKRIKVSAVAGLAPVADLVYAHELAVGDGAVAALLGGSPAECPERYRASSPFDLLPLGVRHLVIHGTADTALPIEMSRRYARKAAAFGDELEYIELNGAGHMEFLDPRSEAHAALVKWLAASV